MSEGAAIGPPPLTVSAAASKAHDPVFELLVTVIHPPKRVRTLNRKTKTTKAVAETKGPFLISVNVGWIELLGIIADGLAVSLG